MTRPRRRSYVLITAAHNEAAGIPRVIRSVAAQTVQPLRWVIVDDGSTDGTARAVTRGARGLPFVLLVRRSPHAGHDTASKVAALRLGLQQVEGLGFAYIGNLDADIELPPTYYEEMLARMAAAPGMGICGGKITEHRGGRTAEVRSADDSVAGAVQLFRRQCFEQVGGYRALPRGFEDALAEVTARAHGWAVRSFADCPVLHLRPMTRSRLRHRFTNGRNEYRLGYRFSFHAARSLARAGERPAVLGSVLGTAGYLFAAVRDHGKFFDPAAARHLRREQGQKLRRALRVTARGREAP